MDSVTVNINVSKVRNILLSNSCTFPTSLLSSPWWAMFVYCMWMCMFTWSCICIYWIYTCVWDITLLLFINMSTSCIHACKNACRSFHVPVCVFYRFGWMCGGVAPVPAGLSKYLGLVQVQLQSRVSALFRRDILLWWVNQCLVCADALPITKIILKGIMHSKIKIPSLITLMLWKNPKNFVYLQNLKLRFFLLNLRKVVRTSLK